MAETGVLINNSMPDMYVEFTKDLLVYNYKLLMHVLQDKMYVNSESLHVYIQLFSTIGFVNK